MKDSIEITILIVSKMLNNACVAGVNANTEWHRPVRLPSYNLLLSDINPKTGKFQKGNRLVLQIGKILNNKPHSEDFIPEWNKLIKVVHVLDNTELLSVISHTDESDTIIKSKLSIKDYLIKSNRSLCVIKPHRIDRHTQYDTYTGKYRPRIYFEFGGRKLDFPCTDIHWRALGRTEVEEEIQEKIIKKDNIYFMIGLTRKFRDEYWPMIVGIHPVPHVKIDYGNL